MKCRYCKFDCTAELDSTSLSFDPGSVDVYSEDEEIDKLIEYNRSEFYQQWFLYTWCEDEYL